VCVYIYVVKNGLLSSTLKLRKRDEQEELLHNSLKQTPSIKKQYLNIVNLKCLEYVTLSLFQRGLHAEKTAAPLVYAFILVSSKLTTLYL
jgi:hypothetical protein